MWVHVYHCIHVEVILQLSRIGSPLHFPGSENVMQDLRFGGEHLLSHLYSPVLLLLVLMYIIIISYLYYLYRSKIYENKAKTTYYFFLILSVFYLAHSYWSHITLSGEIVSFVYLIFLEQPAAPTQEKQGIYGNCTDIY